MTHSEYRRFGHVSRLAMLRCGGPSGSTVNNENSIMQQQLAISGQAKQQQQDQYEQSQRNIEPLVSKEKALASGDRSVALAAAMPTISQISRGYEGSKQSIINALPPGAARDKAIAGLEIQKDTGIAGAQAKVVDEAPGILASVGAQQGAFSLQDLGAALSGYSGASSSNQATAQMQNQQAQAKMAPVLALAGAAGSAAGGTDFSKIFHP